MSETSVTGSSRLPITKAQDGRTDGRVALDGWLGG